MDDDDDSLEYKHTEFTYHTDEHVNICSDKKDINSNAEEKQNKQKKSKFIPS